MDRRDFLLQGCPVAAERGLEFGPLFNPIVGKLDGPVFYVDYTDTESLRRKSASDPNVKLDAFVEIDYSLADGPLSRICAPTAPYGYVVASHVFEHLPNPLGWLRELASMMQPGGIVALAVPDRRHTYDFFRAETTLAQLLAYDLDRLQAPSTLQLADHYLNVRLVDSVASWQRPPALATAPRYHPDEQALFILGQALGGQYIDCHCTVWTEPQFAELLPRAASLLGLPFSILRIHAPVRGSNEFIVQLQRD